MYKNANNQPFGFIVTKSLYILYFTDSSQEYCESDYFYTHCIGE